MGFDDVATVGLGGGLAPHQKVGCLPVDEVAVPLEVVLVDIQPSRAAEEALALGDADDGPGVPPHSVVQVAECRIGGGSKDAKRQCCITPRTIWNSKGVLPKT
jgi:hypothetical protein